MPATLHRSTVSVAAGLLLWAALNGAAWAAPPQDRAGNRLEALIEQPAAGPSPEEAASPRLCTADRQWCLHTARDGDDQAWHLAIEHQLPGEAEPRMRFIPLETLDNGATDQPWPFIVRLAPAAGVGQVPGDRQQAALENVLVGVQRGVTTMYAGGDASASTLVLSRIRHMDDGVQIDPDVLALPADGHAMIRACFGEHDSDRRAGACHDQYRFSSTLTLDPAGQGMPVLRYATTATRFPAGASRLRDSQVQAPLRRQDLQTRTDRTCSFQRVLRFDGSRYQPDTPLPDCTEFTAL
ncbi:hypothetical protein KQ945_11590 [Bacillus subtilis subsp. subtilis]|nr:hypothetical protein [Bacillus subtilis subsp. subtilis]